LGDALRAGQRLDPLPDDPSPVMQAPGPAVPNPERPRFLAAMGVALERAIQALDPRDRLRLKSYYVQDLTLAAIGRLLNEHEATVSRHLTRSRRAIHDGVEEALRAQGLDEGAIRECFETVTDDPESLDLELLVGSPAGRKKTGPDRSK
jgi:DNA-directed RNA polymerase specialized sigma24 family protein